ncbi:MAG: hypothetical protein HOO96_12595 [Polyangiaceae bacterium]|nr:hypothetical protein [Polyangiaceae bacterium]
MNASGLGKQLASLVTRARLEAMRDDVLASAGLERRRPVGRAAAALGFVALGAVGATLAVAFVPQLRRLVAGKNGVAARANAIAATASATAIKELSHAGELVAETAREITGDLRQAVRTETRAVANGKAAHVDGKHTRT